MWTHVDTKRGSAETRTPNAWINDNPYTTPPTIYSKTRIMWVKVFRHSGQTWGFMRVRHLRQKWRWPQSMTSRTLSSQQTPQRPFGASVSATTTSAESELDGAVFMDKVASDIINDDELDDDELDHRLVVRHSTDASESELDDTATGLAIRRRGGVSGRRVR